MNILIINNSPLSTNPLSKWLPSFDCFLITSKESLTNVPQLILKSYAKIITIDNLNNSDLIYYFADKLKQKIDFNHVVGVTELDLIPAARLRKKWKIKGPSLEATIAYRDKSVMKGHLKKNKINIPHFAATNNSLDLISFIKKHGTPVLIKPLSSVRSQGINILNFEKDLYKTLKNNSCNPRSMLENKMVEEYIDAPMFHIDGIIINNKVKFMWPSSYLMKCDDFQEGRPIASCLLMPCNNIFNDLLTYVKNCIKALPSPTNFAFHAEVFHCKNGKFKLCEIAARAGGGPVVKTIENAFNFNINEFALKSSVGIILDSEIKKISKKPNSSAGWIIIPNKFRHSSIDKIPIACPFPEVKIYKIYAKNGDYFGAQREVIAEINITGKSFKDVQKSISSIIKWFEEATTWKKTNSIQTNN